MLRPRFALGVVCCTAAMAVNLISEQAWSDDTLKPIAPAAPAAAGTEDLFAVPESNDEKALQMFLQRLVQTQPEAQSQEGFVAHLNKVDTAVTTVLARPVGDEFYISVSELKLQVLSVLNDLGDKTAKAKLETFLKELQASKRAGVPQLATRFQLQQEVENLTTLDEAGQKALIAKIIEQIKSVSKEDGAALQFTIQLAMSAGEMLQRTNSPIAAPSFAAIVEAIKERKDERLADLVTSLEGTVRRLQLPGNPILVDGKTLGGEAFNINSLKGKVVLVDFWATWCGPCVAELPHLQELYTAYQPKGFEVVGISLDTDKAELESFVKAREVKWPILFEESDGSGWGNKIASHYGISAIPTMILVDREGKVISTSLRGPALDEELEKLLGPLPPKAEK
ncbi:TlpA family protein disulfide reductase [Planctomicrobium sp. SH527]|uniref:TlpA family protein disulfide reductase n=1 Tax=Planctomicrobium sp. SH527 TaxID=3448123 RepID=UPI003F5B5657